MATAFTKEEKINFEAVLRLVRENNSEKHINETHNTGLFLFLASARLVPHTRSDSSKHKLGDGNIFAS